MPAINPNDPMSPEGALDVFRQVASRFTATGEDHAIIQKALAVLQEAVRPTVLPAAEPKKPDHA